MSVHREGGLDVGEEREGGYLVFEGVCDECTRGQGLSSVMSRIGV